MRLNMPVTNIEISMKKNALLVTRTDLHGTITYVNDEFVAISGYTRDELLGANHNIIRHPDMPAAAFEDLWANIKELRPWQGLVKNRTKSGDHYWVDANVLPIFKNGKVHEYLSVRRAPSREKIEKAERFYQQLNAKQAAMRPLGLAALVKAAKEMNVWYKMSVALAVMLVPVLYLMFQLFQAQNYLLLAGVIACVAVSTSIGFYVIQGFTKMLNKSIGIFYRLAEKRFGNVQDLTRNDLIGDFLRALYSMEVNLSLDLAQARDNAAKAMRINQALDNVQSGVMVADTNFEIIYINNSVERIFKEAEQDIRKELPNFDASKLLGASIDCFHKDPAHQRKLLASLNEAYASEMMIGGQHIKVLVSPVIDDDGEHIGFVAEWQNRTQEVRIEHEIENLVQGVKDGDLSSRIEIQGKHGCTRMLSFAINELTDVIQNVFGDINRVMESMAQGDLTVSITNDYQGVYAECKNNINGTLVNLNNLIIQIRDAAGFIDSASQEMASGNNNLSHRVEQQAASLEETAASMEQLASTVKNNAQNTIQATEMVNIASEVAQRGGEIVKSAIVAMQDINDSSNEIAEIISVIDEIAFQTNLLALNASVEAARAGEHGRGFAVVATEVRNLAQRSANAAKQSNDLIQNSVQKVRAGSVFVNETGAALTEIVNSVAQVGEIVAHIASASGEQSAGIQQVNQAVAQMDDITQQNAALAEQAAAGSIAMSEQSGKMSQLLGFFNVTSKKATAVPIKTSTNYHHNAASAPAVQPRSAVHDNTVHVGDEWEEF